jgi:hypothetical protein
MSTVRDQTLREMYIYICFPRHNLQRAVHYIYICYIISSIIFTCYKCRIIVLLS